MNDSEQSARSRFLPPADPSNVLQYASVPRPTLCAIPTKGMIGFLSPITSNSKPGSRTRKWSFEKHARSVSIVGVGATVGASGPYYSIRYWSWRSRKIPQKLTNSFITQIPPIRSIPTHCRGHRPNPKGGGNIYMAVEKGLDLCCCCCSYDLTMISPQELNRMGGIRQTGRYGNYLLISPPAFALVREPARTC